MGVLKKLTNTVAIPIIDAAVDFIPDTDPRKQLFKAVWYSIKGGYGFLAEFMPEEAEDFMKQIGEHRDAISTELLTSKEFQQALIITFDALIRTRSKDKRNIVKKVFFAGYVPAENHEAFELERYYQITEQITLEAVDYLRFIKRDIFPRKKASVDAFLKTKPINDISLPPRERGKADQAALLHAMLDSDHIRAWIYDAFNPESPKALAKHNLPPETWDTDHKKYDDLRKQEMNEISKLDENAAELASLGIFRIVPTKDYTGYILTGFGSGYTRYLMGTVSES